MPPHEKHNPSLREMHALLQEMKTINDEGLHAQHDLDHLEMWNPITAYNNYKQSSKTTAAAWTEVTAKWTKFSKQTKQTILKYVVEHNVNQAWACLDKIIPPLLYKTTKEEQLKKDKINEIIEREDSNTDATIEAILKDFGNSTALQAVLIAKVRDTDVPPS